MVWKNLSTRYCKGLLCLTFFFWINRTLLLFLFNDFWPYCMAQGLNSCLLQWKFRVLTTGLPRKFLFLTCLHHIYLEAQQFLVVTSYFSVVIFLCWLAYQRPSYVLRVGNKGLQLLFFCNLPSPQVYRYDKYPCHRKGPTRVWYLSWF